MFEHFEPILLLNYKQNENVYDYYSLVYQLFQKLPTYQWLVSAELNLPQLLLIPCPKSKVL